VPHSIGLTLVQISLVDNRTRKGNTMREASTVTLEGLNQEIDKIGSLVRSMSIQIRGITTRVADLERWGPRSEIVAMAGKEGKGKKPGKGGKSAKQHGADKRLGTQGRSAR
jgi:hypothetical protein